MSNWKWIPFLVAAAAAIYYFNYWGETIATAPKEPLSVSLTVSENPHVASTQRLGLNTSSWTTYGAEQYMRNILKNPGFEGKIDRIVVIVQRSDKDSFSDGSGLGQIDGYWKEATYDVRSGSSVGQKGKISNSLKEGFGGLPQYFSEGELPELKENDVVVLTKFSNPNPVEQWWIPEQSIPYVKVVDEIRRSGSDGKNLLVLSPQDGETAEINFYLDMLTEKYGKLLTCQGPWRLSFWIRSEGNETPQVSTFFRRINANNFVKKDFNPTSEWQRVEFDFNPTDTGPDGPLQFQLSARGDNTHTYVDDIALGPIQTNGEDIWRQDVVEMIKKLRPAYLRDWQGQTSDTFQNRLAADYARKPYVQRGFGGQGESNFSFSIPDFLDLCHKTQANPWIVIPTTLGDHELQEFGNYLSSHANKDNFSEVILEFGNENWNWAFRSQGIPFPASHGAVAERAFQFISAAAGPNVPLRKAINAQFANPAMGEEFMNGSPSADLLGVAPYFFNQLEQSATEEETLGKMFAVDEKNYQQFQSFLSPREKKMGIYEINLHTTNGNATTEERNKYLPSAVAGTALAKHLLVALENKASPICLFCFAQISTKAKEAPNNGEIPLWGIVRDVSTTKRFRPTGLAMQMLNEVIAGSLHKTKGGEETPIKATAFRTADQWSAAIVSEHPETATVSLQFPQDQRNLPTRSKVLDAHSPFDNNEIEEQVKIALKDVLKNDRTVTVQVPPYGFVILTADND